MPVTVPVALIVVAPDIAPAAVMPAPALLMPFRVERPVTPNPA